MVLGDLLSSAAILGSIIWGALLFSAAIRWLYARLSGVWLTLADAVMGGVAGFTPVSLGALASLAGVRLGGPLDSIMWRAAMVIVVTAFFVGWWCGRRQQRISVPWVLLLWAAGERSAGLGLLWEHGIVGVVFVTVVTVLVMIINSDMCHEGQTPARLSMIVAVSTVATIVLVIGTAAPFGSPYQADVSAVYAQRSASALLGNDYLGRSVLARAFEAHRMTLAVSLMSAGLVAMMLRFGMRWLKLPQRVWVFMPLVWIGLAVSGVRFSGMVLAPLLALTLVPSFETDKQVSLGEIFLAVTYGMLALIGMSAIAPDLLGGPPLAGSIFTQTNELVQLARVTGDSRGIFMLGGWSLLTVSLLWPLLLIQPPKS